MFDSDKMRNILNLPAFYSIVKILEIKLARYGVTSFNLYPLTMLNSDKMRNILNLSAFYSLVKILEINPPGMWSHLSTGIP